MIAAVSLGVLAVTLVAPHAMRFDAAPPSLAAAVWLLALLLRASATAVGVVVVVLIAPSTDVAHALTHWCWHTVVPLLAAHLGLGGHVLVDAAVLIPALVLLASAVSVALSVARAARSMKRLVARGLGPGPRNSVIVGGREIVLAAAGLRRPRVLVSAGALTLLDDAELNAGLDHEHGHIARRHRWVLLVAQLAHAIGRFVPGAKRAFAELVLHLERDADRYALKRRHAPWDLASAICKAADSWAFTAAAAAGLAGGGVLRRVRQLVDDEPPPPAVTAPRLMAMTLAAGVIVLFSVVGPAAVTVAESAAASGPPPAKC